MKNRKIFIVDFHLKEASGEWPQHWREFFQNEDRAVSAIASYQFSTGTKEFPNPAWDGSYHRDFRDDDGFLYAQITQGIVK